MWILVTAISERYSTDDDQSETSDHRFLQLLAQLAPMAMNLLGGLFGGSGGRTFSKIISLFHRVYLEQAPQAPAAPPPSPQQIISKIFFRILNKSLELICFLFQFSVIQHRSAR